jgi:putative DNA primase/helicase
MINGGNKPIPEYQQWRGRRILYCSEPNADDKMNSGIMKELTGGEQISYRLLFCNHIHKFSPMFKMHIMCNDTPQIDGSDQGVKRRIRKVDYKSRFVDVEDVDETNHIYKKDTGFIENFKTDTRYKLEFLRNILDHYDHNYSYEMPEVIRMNSALYLDDNNVVLQFVNENIQKVQNGFVTLKDMKERFKESEYYDTKVNLKTSLERILKTQCQDQKRFNNRKYRHVFEGYTLCSPSNEVLDI